MRADRGIVSWLRHRHPTHGRWRSAGIFVFAVCCLIDASILRPTWQHDLVGLGEFRRGYFERIDGAVGLALDDAIRPDTVPTFLPLDAGRIAVPPGMTLVAALAPGQSYRLVSEKLRVPYFVIGSEAPLPAAVDSPAATGEARLIDAYTLGLRDGHLVLESWDPTRPWRDDATRLAALRAACAGDGGSVGLDVIATADALEIHLGTCTTTERAAARGTLLLAALAGPEWLTVARHPDWRVEHRILWPVLAAVVAKVGALWWAFGGISAATVSFALGLAALRLPIPVTLMWPFTLLVGAAGTIVRVAVLGLRRLPPRWRLPAALGVAIAGLLTGRWLISDAPPSFPPIQRNHPDHEPMRCAVIGYSTVAGEGLRRHEGGVRRFLDEDCTRCRGQTGGLFAGGETLSWARDAYCASPTEFGADGQVIFLGGVNDDFLTGVLSIARMVIVGWMGSEPWQQNQIAAAAAARAQTERQAAALQGLIDCVHARGAQFLLLHDFLVTDMETGRSPDRAAMLDSRRAVVEAAGGTFVNLLDPFAADAGVSWFNDYVHLSAIAHERVANLACPLSP